MNIRLADFIIKILLMRIYKLSLRKNWDIYLLFILCLCISPARGQTYAEKAYYLIDSLNLDELGESDKHLIDSALKLYHQAKHDSDRLNSIMILTQKMVHEDWSKYNEFLYIELQEMLAGSSLTEKESLYGKKMLANVMGDLGFYAVSVQGDFNKALDYFHEALDLSEEIGDKYNMVTMLNNIGSASERFGDIPRALDCYHKSLMICKKISHKKGIPSLLNNIGLINMEQGNYTEALDYLTESLKIHEELQEHENVARNLENIGLIYSRIGNSEKAMSYMLRSLNTAEVSGDKIIIADPYVEELANGEPGWKLLANVGIALLLFPFHTVLDKRLKKRIIKNSKTKILSKP